MKNKKLGFRERERIKRKMARWVANFAALPTPERKFIYKALVQVERVLESKPPPKAADGKAGDEL